MALKGIKVMELAGLAPSPFAGMILTDFGAKVIRIDKLTAGFSADTLGRGKQSASINLKNARGCAVVKRLCKRMDVVIEPFRPGVMEKLGLGPDTLMKENPGLVYCRLSGFGQTGPYRMKAGHDINYIATSGVLSKLQRKGGKPTAPLNLVADFAGGGLLAAFGIVTALFERQRSGLGQVIDVNMVAGSAYASSFMFTAQGLFPNPPGENLLDTGAPFYDTFRTKDGKYVSIGALEPKFFKKFLEGLQLYDDDTATNQLNSAKWPQLRERIAEAISMRALGELSNLIGDDDSCVMPVLTPGEAALDPHNIETDTYFKDPEGHYIPNPAPRLSRTPAIADQGPQPTLGGNTKEVLRENGFTEKEIADLISSGVVADNVDKSKM